MYFSCIFASKITFYCDLKMFVIIRFSFPGWQALGNHFSHMFLNCLLLNCKQTSNSGLNSSAAPVTCRKHIEIMFIASHCGCHISSLVDIGARNYGICYDVQCSLCSVFQSCDTGHFSTLPRVEGGLDSVSAFYEFFLCHMMSCETSEMHPADDRSRFRIPFSKAFLN